MRIVDCGINTYKQEKPLKMRSADCGIENNPSAVGI
jgi:hypothetical protein